MHRRIVKIGFILIIIAFCLPLIADLYSSFRNKKLPINISNLIEDGRETIIRDSISISFEHSDSTLLRINSYRYNYKSIEQDLSDAWNETAKNNIPNINIILLTAIIDSSNNTLTKEDNYKLLNIICKHFNQVYQENQYEDFLDSIKLFLINNNKVDLIEPAALIKISLDYDNARYDQVYSECIPLLSNWIDYSPFQQIFVNTLWQNASFAELKQLLESGYIHDDIKNLFSARLSNLQNTNSIDGIQPLTTLERIGVYILFGVIVFIIFISLKDILIYFKIFYSYKMNDIEKRLALYKKVITKKNKQDIICPVCGGDDLKIQKQPYHNQFPICNQDEQILTDSTSCGNCGVRLDEYLNCPVCGFNQKGELTFVFIYDIITSLIFIGFISSLAFQIIQQIFPISTKLSINDLKIISYCFLILGMFISLLPFISRDLGVIGLKKVYLYERFFFVSINKAVNFICVNSIYSILSPINAIYLSQQFFTIFDLFYIVLYAYTLLKLFTFGQERLQYYKNLIKNMLLGAIIFLAILPLLYILPSIDAVFDNFNKPLNNLAFIDFINRIIFFFMAIVLLIKETNFKNVKHFYNMVFFFNEYFDLIMFWLIIILLSTDILLIRWFLAFRYIDINLNVHQIIILFFYYLLIENPSRKKDSSKRSISGLNYAHNFYVLIYVLCVSILSFASIIPIFRIYVKNYTLIGTIKTIIYLVNINLNYLLNSIDNLPIHLFIGILSSFIIIVLLLFIFFKKIIKLYNFTRGKVVIGIEEGRRINLLMKHLEVYSKNFNLRINLLNEKNIIVLKRILWEEKYLIVTQNSSPLVNRLNIQKKIDKLIKQNNWQDGRSYQMLADYIKSTQSITENYYSMVPEEDRIWLEENKSLFDESMQIEYLSKFRFVMIWEKNIRNMLLKTGTEYLQISERLWLKSLKLYAKALSRFYHQISLSNFKYAHPYSISPLNYFVLVISDQPFFPASIEKLFAMSWHNKKYDDFVYVYFCDNFPQVKTGNYLTSGKDKNIVNKLNRLEYDQKLQYYSYEVNLMRNEFSAFLSEINKMGYRCEFYPVDTTIKIENGVRTKYDENESGNVKGDLVTVKEEYYQAKIALVIEKTNITANNLDYLEKKNQDLLRDF